VAPRAVGDPEVSTLDQHRICRPAVGSWHLRRRLAGTGAEEHEQRNDTDQDLHSPTGLDLHSPTGLDLHSPTGLDLHHAHRGHDTGPMGMNPFRPRRGSRTADIVFVAAALVVCALLLAWAAFG
jgi:hypothetical protein